MGRLSPHAAISSSSRRRLARWLVGSPISVVERDLILETLAHTHGNRTLSARLLGLSVRTLRNKITEYAAEGLSVPGHESRKRFREAGAIVSTNPALVDAHGIGNAEQVARGGYQTLSRLGTGRNMPLAGSD